MTDEHERQIQATKKQVAKLLELEDEEEKEILDAGMNIVAAVAASGAGEKLNKQLRSMNEEFRK